MTTERFTRIEFEEVLPCFKGTEKPMWEKLGLLDGEFTYLVKMTDGFDVQIRSSIDSSGFAQDTGQNSIRMNVVFKYDDGSIRYLKGTDAYTTREPGWQKRMIAKLRELYKKYHILTRPIKVCKCGERPAVWKLKSGSDQGKTAIKCFGCNSKIFVIG